MESVLASLRGWAQEVFLVDSYSRDNTVEIAFRHGVYVVQRRFSGFGDQWNFALHKLPIGAPWTMKIDPDERLTESLKKGIIDKISQGDVEGISFDRRLWFMGQPLPIKQEIVRVWKTGRCRFTDVAVNEHPIVDGRVGRVSGELEHHDSPDLHHWIEKQNRYSSAEAVAAIRGDALAASPRIFGSRLEKRMWFKKHFNRIPARYLISWVINLVQVRVWQSGRVGFAWSRLRVWARRMKEDKINEMLMTGRELRLPPVLEGDPHPMAVQAGNEKPS